MIKNDKQMGRPFVHYMAPQAEIETFFSTEGMMAYATDTKVYGFYNGTMWVWGADPAGHTHAEFANIGLVLASGTDHDPDHLEYKLNVGSGLRMVKEYDNEPGDGERMVIYPDANLNADTVDHKHASDFAAADHTHASVGLKKHAQTIGDGFARAFDIHAPNVPSGTAFDPVVQVVDVNTHYVVYPGIYVAPVGTVNHTGYLFISFETAPTSGQYCVVVVY